MLENINGFLRELKGLRWYTVIFIFVATVLYLFNHEIVRLIEVEWSDTDIVLESLENDIVIDNALFELMKDSKADRAYIFRFHNGVQYYNGTHKSKMSCDYEVVRKGVNREAERLQDLPTALYSRWIRDVINHKMYVLDIEDIEDLRVKQSLEEQGIKALAVAPYYRDGKVFALIGIDYIHITSVEDAKKWQKNQGVKKLWFQKRTEMIGELLL